MNIQTAKQSRGTDGTINTIIVTLTDNKVLFVPMDTDNTDYAEILKQVADGDITIAEAD